jgi:hypothetical protein
MNFLKTECSKKDRPDEYLVLEQKKWVSYLYRTAQPPTLASFRTWGSSAGAGRIRLTRRKSIKIF